MYNFTKGEIRKLQTKENDSYRTAFGARKGTANAALRGEIGASLMETRLIESRLMLAYSMQNGTNELVRQVLQRVRGDKKNIWNKKLHEDLGRVDMSFESMTSMSKEEVKKRIRELDSKMWDEDIATKSSLTKYRKYKKEIKEEHIYDNRFESKLLFRARTGTLDLNIERRHKGENTTCDICKEGDGKLCTLLTRM